MVSVTAADLPGADVWRLIVDKVRPSSTDLTAPSVLKAVGRCEFLLFAPGMPDAERLEEWTNLAKYVKRLVLVFATCESDDAFPPGVCAIEPVLDLQQEEDAFSAEETEAAYFEQRYGRRP